MGARSIVGVVYIDDFGNPYSIRQQESIRVACGNQLASEAGSLKSLPRLIKPRAVHAKWFGDGGPGQAVGEFRRTLVIGVPGNDLWTGVDRTITLMEGDSVPGVGQTTPNVQHEFTVTGRRGESETYSA